MPAPIWRSTTCTASIWPSGSGSGGVDHMDEERRLRHLLQGRPERLDQLVGEAADEPHRVADQHGFAAGQRHPPHRRVEGGEQPVLDQHTGLGEPVEERRLAGVGVPDQRHHGDLGPSPCLGVGGPGLTDSGQLALELGDPFQDAAAIRLQLGLTRAAGVDAGTESAHLQASAAEPGETVPVLGQLHLDPTLVAGGVLGEDVEDERHPVDHVDVERLLQVALLGGDQLVVEHHHVDVQGSDLGGDLGRLPRADQPRRVGMVAAHQHALNRVRSGGVGRAGPARPGCARPRRGRRRPAPPRPGRRVGGPPAGR